MLTSEEIQKQINTLEESLGKLKEEFKAAQAHEEEMSWFKRCNALRIRDASRPNGDWLEVEDYSPQEELTNVERAIIYITVYESRNDEKVTTHLNYDGAVELRDFLNKRIDFHGKI